MIEIQRRDQEEHKVTINETATEKSINILKSSEVYPTLKSPPEVNQNNATFQNKNIGGIVKFETSPIIIDETDILKAKPHELVKPLFINYKSSDKKVETLKQSESFLNLKNIDAKTEGMKAHRQYAVKQIDQGFEAEEEIISEEFSPESESMFNIQKTISKMKRLRSKMQLVSQKKEVDGIIKQLLNIQNRKKRKKIFQLHEKFLT